MRTLAPRNATRTRARVASVLALVLLAVSVPRAEEAPPAPDWSLDTVDGRTVRFHADTAGKPSVLFFWATWCPYCRALFPRIEAIRKDYGERGVEVFALNIWEDADPVAYLRQHGYEVTAILTADLVAEDYGVKGTPAVYVVDGQRIAHQRRPGDTDENLERAVRAALDTALGATTR